MDVIHQKISVGKWRTLLHKILGQKLGFWFSQYSLVYMATGGRLPNTTLYSEKYYSQEAYNNSIALISSFYKE